MVKFANILTIASLVLLVLSCTGAPDEEQQPSPVSQVQFSSAWSESRAADFAVLYNFSLHAQSGELLWRKTGNVERWDFFGQAGAGPEPRPFLGESIVDATEAQRGCKWDLNESRDASVDCAQGSCLFSIDEAFRAPFTLFTFRMESVETILGRQVNCYAGGTPDAGKARVCLSADGLPLSLEVQFGRTGPLSLQAIAVKDPSSDDVLLKLPPDDLRPLTLPTVVASSDLILPDLPSLDEYLAHQ